MKYSCHEVLQCNYVTYNSITFFFFQEQLDSLPVSGLSEKFTVWWKLTKILGRVERGRRTIQFSICYSFLDFCFLSFTWSKAHWSVPKVFFLLCCFNLSQERFEYFGSLVGVCKEDVNKQFNKIMWLYIRFSWI